MNDCFAVTKLAHYILPRDELPTPPPTITYEQISDDEDEQIKQNDNEQSINLCPINDDYDIEGVHVQNEFPMINELNESLVIIPHPLGEVHVRDELPNDIEMISDDDEQQELNINEQQCKIKNKVLTRNQRKTRKKKINRYRYEVIRNVHHKFTTTGIKRILINMNIRFGNLNVVGHTLFLDLKNLAIRERVDKLLHDEMFTKEHYDRIHKRSHHH